MQAFTSPAHAQNAVQEMRHVLRLRGSADRLADVSRWHSTSRSLLTCAIENRARRVRQSGAVGSSVVEFLKTQAKGRNGKPMPWNCPECGTSIKHTTDLPRPDVTYRCPVCHLELVADSAIGKMTVAPMPGNRHAPPDSTVDPTEAHDTRPFHKKKSAKPPR